MSSTTTTTTTTTISLEPFPTFVDSVDSSSFSKMSASQLFSPSGAMMLRKKQDNITSDISKYISQHYYQYEVTMGLYVMTPMEKLVCNTIILGILAAISYAMYYGLQPFFVRSICQVIYYLSGSLSGIEDICPDPSCS